MANVQGDQRTWPLYFFDQCIVAQCFQVTTAIVAKHNGHSFVSKIFNDVVCLIWE